MEEDGKRSMLKVMNDRCYKRKENSKVVGIFSFFCFSNIWCCFLRLKKDWRVHLSRRKSLVDQLLFTLRSRFVKR